jgi:putative RecB family exonuclease
MARYSALKVRIFQTCRLRFRYQYIAKDTDRIRPRLRPADTAGSLVHRILCDFYTRLQPEQRTEEGLLELFETGWNALSAGYHRIPGVEQYHETSIHQLRNYVRCFDYAVAPYMVEPYIQVDIRPGATLFGRLDRLDENLDGSLHIIDYKGGSLPGDVDSGQLVFYALMTEIKFERRVSRVSFWYLDDGSVWTTELSEMDKEQARLELMTTIDEMAKADEFSPTVAPHCASCPFLHGCASRSEISQVRQQDGW